VKTTVVRNILRTLKITPKDKNANNNQNTGEFSSTLKKFFTKPREFSTQVNYSKNHQMTNEFQSNDQPVFFSKQDNQIPHKRTLNKLKLINRTINNFQSSRNTLSNNPNQYLIFNNKRKQLDSDHHLNSKKAQSVTPDKWFKRTFDTEIQSPDISGYQTLSKFPGNQSQIPVSSINSRETFPSTPRGVYRSVSPYMISGLMESSSQKQTLQIPRASRQNKPFVNQFSNQLSSVNEIQHKQSNAPLSTYSNAMVWIPNNVNDLLLMLLKKMLVYSSKIEALQAKLLQNNPLFYGGNLLKNIRMENQKFLTLHDMSYFVHCFDFKVSDWEAFRLMCYLSQYRLASLAELVIQENIDEASISLIPEQFFEVRPSSLDIQNSSEAKVLALSAERPKYYISTSSLFDLLMPKTKPVLPNLTSEELKHHQKKIKKREFLIIRKILFLIFRKIEEIGIIVHYIRKYDINDIFEFLLDFNDKSNQSK
jgi:hypothetical protein